MANAEKASPRSILFICMGGIGDVIMMLPAVTALAERWPQARLHMFLTHNGSRAVVELLPGIGEIVEVAQGRKAAPSAVAAVLRCRPDLVFASTETNPLFCGLIGLLAGARWRVGEAFGAGRILYNVTVPFSTTVHQAHANALIAQRFTTTRHPVEYRVPVSREDRMVADRVIASIGPQPWVGFHLGSGIRMAYKRWPVERFVELGKRLTAELGYRIVIMAGPGEEDASAVAAQAIGASAMVVGGMPGVRPVLELLRKAALFVTNDSGLMHVACAAGCPVVAIFGPTDERRDGPIGRHVRVVAASVPCRPCHRNNQPISCEHCSCMRGITVEQVMSAAVELAREK